MIPPRCFTCGHVLANLELIYEQGLLDIDNDVNLNSNQKAKAKRDLVDKLLPDKWKYRYCCRTRLMSTVDLIKVVL